MRLVNIKLLSEFRQKHADAGSHVDAWQAEAAAACWQTPLDIKRKYAGASILPENKVVFNIKGNKYRLKVKVSYKSQIILVEKIGTHNEYMKW